MHCIGNEGMNWLWNEVKPSNKANSEDAPRITYTQLPRVLILHYVMQRMPIDFDGKDGRFEVCFSVWTSLHGNTHELAETITTSSRKDFHVHLKKIKLEDSLATMF